MSQYVCCVPVFICVYACVFRGYLWLYTLICMSGHTCVPLIWHMGACSYTWFCICEGVYVRSCMHENTMGIEVWWKCPFKIARNSRLRVVPLSHIITRALQSSWARCHPSTSQRTSNAGMVYPPSGDGARDHFFTDHIPCFCLWKRPDGAGQQRVSHPLGSPPVCQPSVISKV